MEEKSSPFCSGTLSHACSTTDIQSFQPALSVFQATDTMSALALVKVAKNDVARVCSVIIPNATSMQCLRCQFKSRRNQAKVFLWINHFHTTLMT